jgi:hypothetical protein
MKSEIDHQICVAIKAFRKPAGDDPRFQSMEGCLANREEFITITHNVYKAIHYDSINHIHVADGFLSACKKTKCPSVKTKIAHEYRNLWRRLNDAIVWQMLGQQRHLIKRLTLYRDHGYLVQQNPDSIRRALETINAEPLSLGLWTDATSCVDVGDILQVDRKTGKISILEVKEGSVNDEIFKLPPCPHAIHLFVEKHGQKGLKQLVQGFTKSFTI